ncbi:AEC family transporter [Stappia indica]|uniref:Malonate transporter n=1 Tax=Stappia indica TaxID=538381 RepID=A0A857C2X4_9HYPH|nr:AEC family transporter [Stappia indica]QGZ33165.1 hypothetical protein GH266_00785 [Stappia indica]
MLLTLSITGPFFAVIAFGFFAAKRGWMPDGAVRSLNVFVFNFAMPALVIRALAGQDIIAALTGPMVPVWVLAGGVTFALAMLAMRLLCGGGLAQMAVSGQAATIGNIGFLGLPLMLAAFGDRAAAPMAVVLVLDLTIFIPLCIGLLEWASGKGASVRLVATVAKGVIFNPFVLAIVGGTILSLAGGKLPPAGDNLLNFLGDAAGATALFSLGVQLASRRVEGEVGAISLMIVMKLFVHPLAVFTAALLLGLDAANTAVLVVVASLPIAGNVFVVAERYGIFLQQLSAAILLSTTAGVITVSLALTWAGL